MDDWARKETRYSLYNQLLNAALLSGIRLPLISSWNKQAAYQVDVAIGWHDYHNQVIRIIMPGIRRSFGWDSYDAGWMGTHSQVYVNQEENRLYTETISTYHHGFSNYSLYIYRSEYALGMCTLLQAYPEVLVQGDNTDTFRPESFRKVQEQEEINFRNFEKHELAGIIKNRFRKRFRKLKENFVRVIAFSLNDKEAMFSVSVKQTGTNAFEIEPYYFLFGIDTQKITETDLSTAFVYESAILKLFRQQDQRFVFVQGPGQDLLKVRLQPRTPHQPAVESILEACLDPENRFLVFCRNTQLEIRQVQTGKLIHKLPYEQESGLPSDLSLAGNSSSFVVAFSKLVKQYAYTGKTEQILLAPLPRGSLLFLASLDSYIYQREVFDVETGQVRYRMEPGAIATVPSYTTVQTWLSRRESYFFEKSEFLISVWHAVTGSPFTALEATTDHYGVMGFLVGFAVSPDERFVISARDGRQVVVWDLSLPGAFRALPHWQLNGLEGGNRHPGACLLQRRLLGSSAHR